jgi:uncharacterized protein
VAALALYFSLGRRILSTGGKVRTEGWGLPDLLITLLLGGLLGPLSILAMIHPRQEARTFSVKTLIDGASSTLIVVGGLIAFLLFRRINLRQLFGWNALARGRAMWLGLGLMVISGPLVLLVNALTEKLVEVTEQDLVKYFREMLLAGNLEVVSMIGLTAVVFAPLSEEFLFRGYFYGVLKRYCGPAGSAVLSAALFAAVHAHAPSFAPLFVLALCLTIAYELSGSLLVPICMHAAFNASELATLYYTVLHGS